MIVLGATGDGTLYRTCTAGDEIGMNDPHPAAYKDVIGAVSDQLDADPSIDYRALGDGRRVIVAERRGVVVGFSVIDLTGTRAAIEARATALAEHPDNALDFAADAMTYCADLGALEGRAVAHTSAGEVVFDSLDTSVFGLPRGFTWIR